MLFGYGEKGTPVQCWWECKFTQPGWNTVWRRFLKKLEIALSYELPLPGIYLKKTKTLIRYTHTQTGMLCRHKKGSDHVICNNIDGQRGYCAK